MEKQNLLERKREQIHNIVSTDEYKVSDSQKILRC